MLIKNSLILNDEFQKAFTSLMTLKMPAKQCLELSSCIEDLKAQREIVIRAKRAIADKYCKKDSEGKPEVDKSGNLIFDTPELFSSCMDELKEISEEEIDLALSKKVKISSIEIMTPLQVTLLKDIIQIED